MEEKITVTHVISSIDISTGGPARSVTHVIQEMLQVNPQLKICLETLKSPKPIIDNFKNSNGNIHFNNFGLFGFSKELQANLKSTNTNLFHGHGLWQMPVHHMAKIARKRNIPYIITSRGMLEPWSLSQSKFKKQLALWLFQRNDLKQATCLHATAPMEVQSIRNLGFKNPIAMIPNGVNLDSFPSVVPVKSNQPKRILFLSRIHPKKGIENLIESWKQLDDKLKQNWVIDIYGNGECTY